MKVQPVKSAGPRRYPSLEEARLRPRLLEAVPRRWSVSPALAAAVGLGLLARPVELQAEEEEPGLVASAAKAVAGKAAEAVDAVKEKAGLSVAAWVVPVLAEALQQDGRGAFGCVAIDPPVILSEAEALEIIQAELKAAGLKTELNVRVDGVYQPVDSSGLVSTRRKSGGETTISTSFREGPRELGRSEAVFDLGDRERSVFIEYFSLKDYEKWMGHSMSTVSSYDFPALVPRVSDAYSRKVSEKRETYGIFFDPLAHRPWAGGRGGIKGLTPAQERLVSTEAGREEGLKARTLPEQSREKLREQVRYFVKQLREKGVLPPA